MSIQKIITMTLFLCLFFSCGKSDVIYEKELISGSIINGEESSNTEHPWQVSLQYGGFNQHFCGGSLIAKNLILTAAHCVESVPYWISIDAKGGSPTGLLKDAKMLPKVKKYVIHPGRKAGSHAHDVALIFLEEDVTLSENLQVVSLPNNDEIQISEVFSQLEENNATVNISGWGLVESPVKSADGRRQSGGKDTNQLMTLDVDAVASTQFDLKNEETEKELIKQFNFPKGLTNFLGSSEMHLLLITSKDINNPASSCQGDSGGPMTVLFDGDDEPVLVGITSFGVSLGSLICDGVTAYVDVQHYLPWIKSLTVAL
jgi:secreted trypsin-like serine protease